MEYQSMEVISFEGVDPIKLNQIIVLPISVVNKEIFLRRGPSLNMSDIIPIQPVKDISGLKKGDILLKIDRKIGIDNFIAAIILGDYDETKDEWSWNFINDDGSPNHISGNDKATTFFIPPIPITFPITTDIDDFNGDTINYTHITPENTFTIVSNSVRKIMDLKDFYYVYIPLSDEEKTKFASDIDGLINPCWRLKATK